MAQNTNSIIETIIFLFKIVTEFSYFVDTLTNILTVNIYLIISTYSYLYLFLRNYSNLIFKVLFTVCQRIINL